MRPRLGFLGVGWIGRARLEALARSGTAAVAAVADVDGSAAAAVAAAHGAEVMAPEALLEGRPGLDGVVIATPNAGHAAEATAALSAGLAVFCQKPLGRTAPECEAVVRAARSADLLLGVDLSYRHLAAVAAIRAVIARGSLGDLYAADLVFHNAYGPDRAWYTDPSRAGGGCVIDLGIHLVDLALWLLGPATVEAVTARLFAGGRPLGDLPGGVEDYAVARLDLSSGAVATMACSWFLHAGRDAVISASFHGTSGSVSVGNVGGSFHDFRASHATGTASAVIAEPPDDWGGRALVRWAEGLAHGRGFSEEALEVVAVARVLDRIYGR